MAARRRARLGLATSFVVPCVLAGCAVRTENAGAPAAPADPLAGSRFEYATSVVRVRPSARLKVILPEFAKLASPKARGLSFLGIDLAELKCLELGLDLDGRKMMWAASTAGACDLLAVARAFKGWGGGDDTKALPEPKVHEGVNLHVIAEDYRGALVIGAIRPGVLCLGTTELVMGAVEKHKAGAAVAYNKRMRDALSLAEQDADVVVAVLRTPENNDDMLGTHSAGYEGLESVTVAVKAGEGLAVRVVVAATSAEKAQEMRTDIQGAIDRSEVSPKGGVENVAVTLDGNRVTVTAKLGPAIVAQGKSPAEVLSNLDLTSNRMKFQDLWELVKVVE